MSEVKRNTKRWLVIGSAILIVGIAVSLRTPYFKVTTSTTSAEIGSGNLDEIEIDESGQVPHYRGRRWAVSLDGNSYAMATESGFSVVGGQFDGQLTFGDVNIQLLEFSPDGKWLAALEVGGSGPARVYLIAMEMFEVDGNERRSGLSAVSTVLNDDGANIWFSADSKQLTVLQLFGKVGFILSVPELRLVRNAVLEFPKPQTRLQRDPSKTELSVKSDGNTIVLEKPGGVIGQDADFIGESKVGAMVGDKLVVWSLETGKILYSIDQMNKVLTK